MLLSDDLTQLCGSGPHRGAGFWVFPLFILDEVLDPFLCWTDTELTPGFHGETRIETKNISLHIAQNIYRQMLEGVTFCDRRYSHNGFSWTSAVCEFPVCYFCLRQLMGVKLKAALFWAGATCETKRQMETLQTSKTELGFFNMVLTYICIKCKK